MRRFMEGGPVRGFANGSRKLVVFVVLLVGMLGAAAPAFANNVDVAVYKIGGGSLFEGTHPIISSSLDSKGVELGLRFKSSTPLAIEGIRFYKGVKNTGTHIGNLWNEKGELLATATFTKESPFGWQFVRFAK